MDNNNIQVPDHNNCLLKLKFFIEKKIWYSNFENFGVMNLQYST